MTGTLFDWRAHLKVHPAADLLPMMSEAEIQNSPRTCARTARSNE